MNLSDEQFEDIIQENEKFPENIDQADKARIQQHIAVRQRLQKAADSIHARDSLADRIRGRIQEAGSQKRTANVIHLLLSKGTALAAAAMVIFAVGVFFMITGTTTIQAEIAQIHRDTVAGHNDFVCENDPECICKRLSGNCSTCVMLPQLKDGGVYIGSGLSKFRDKDVAAVLVEVDGSKVTIISVKDDLKSLKFSHEFKRSKRDWCNCAHKECNMAAVGLEEHTYIAAGEVKKEVLLSLLDKLVETH